MGVDNYEPRVLHQLLEYMHSYCAEIFADSSLYAEHAGRPGQLECEDVQLSARLKAQASQPHAPLLMEQMARSRNSKSIAAPTVPNIQLPNLKLCLVEENWQLEPRAKRQATASNGAVASSAAEGSGASSGGPGRPAAPSALSSGRVAFALPARSSSGAFGDGRADKAGSYVRAERDSGVTLDATMHGNIGRFLNHSCNPNLTKRVVFPGPEPREAGGAPYRLAFFAMRHIAAMEELTYDYGYVNGSVPGCFIACYCGADHCSRRLL